MENSFDFSLEPGKKLDKILYTDYKIVISIITPTFNTKKSIIQTANSILSQTYPYFEWIIVDDGSTDKESSIILKDLSSMDERIKVFYKDNEGPGKARDYGVEKSNKDTKYIVFIDDDDLIEKTFLETAYYSMNTYKEASWCYSDVVNFGSYNLLWAKHFTSKVMRKENLLVNQAMIKKDDFNSVGGFEITGKGIYEDWILWLKLLKKGYYPIHMSYYGFWYRKTNNESNFQLAQENEKKNKELIKKYSKDILNSVKPIEFPRIDNSNVKENDSKIIKVIEPCFKNEKNNILIIMPSVQDEKETYLDLINSHDSNIQVTILCTKPNAYYTRQQLENINSNCTVFDLTTFLDFNYWKSFIDYLISTRKIKLIINADENLELKCSNVKIITEKEFIHNKDVLDNIKNLKNIKNKNSEENGTSLVFKECFYTEYNKACIEYRNTARDNDPQTLALKIKRMPKAKKKKIVEKLWKKPAYRKFVKTIKGDK